MATSKQSKRKISMKTFLVESFQYNGYSEQSVCNLIKRRTLPPLFSGEIFKNGWHSPSGRLPRKHSSWNHFSIIATLNNQSVNQQKDQKKDSITKKFSKMDGFLRLLMLREMLNAFPRLKVNITFSKALSSYLQSLNGTSQILLFGMLKVWVFLKAISSNFLDPPEEVFVIVETKNEID